MSHPLVAPPPVEPLRGGPAPTLSVVVATFNCADVVGEALESVFGQTHAPHEVIVCDDGSSDDIEAALEQYMDRIVFVRKQHAGEASAKNAAAAAASGDFVVILDADDVFLPQRLAALSSAAAERPDLELITTDAYLEVDGTIVRRCYDGRWTFEVDDQRRELLRRNFVFGLTAVRRETLLRHGGFDESILWTTDWECWIRFVLDGAKIGCVPEPLALYRLRETSLSSQREDMTRGKIATLEKTSRDPRLTDEERRIVAESIDLYLRELALLEIRRAVASGDEIARARARSILFGRRFSWRARLEAAAIAIDPARMRRRLERQEAETWVGAGGIRVRRPLMPEELSASRDRR